MSDFATIRQSLMPVFLAIAGEAIDYYPPKTTTPINLKATLGPLVRDNVPTVTGRAADEVREIKIMGVASGVNLPVGLDAAAFNGRFVINAEEWVLSRVIASNTTCHHLELRRVTQREDVGRQTITPYRIR